MEATKKQSLTRITPKVYLEILEKLKIIPNFFISESYLNFHKEIELWKRWDLVYAVSGDALIFPPVVIPTKNNTAFYGLSHYKEIWCDWESKPYMVEDWSNKPVLFLDWEYIYDPKHFMDLSGGKWKTFRKNINKWPSRNSDFIYTDKRPDPYKIADLLLKWINNREVVYDAEYLVELATNDKITDVFITYLYKRDRTLVAMNIADQNWFYINYRWCITDPDEPYLEEFTRLLFYRSMINMGKLVNDGGSLGYPGLERFKDKLNPIKKLIRNTIILK